MQRRVASAADQLEDLGDELDLADAAGAEFDVVDHVLARHFATNLRVQVAHGVNCAEIEIFAENEGAGNPPQRGHPVAQRSAVGIRAGVHDPRFDPGVAFPLAALGDEIVFQRVERADQRAGIAIRAQPHIDPENLAIGGQVAERTDHPLAESGKEIVVFDTFLAVGVAFFRVHKNVINVGRNIQFASTQLAHADDQQALRQPGFVERFAIRGNELAVVIVEREVGGDIGEQGHALHDLGQ